MTSKSSKAIQLGLIRHYLKTGSFMQIATVSPGGPWIATVYYVLDNDLNLYWLSWPTRRHSQEIAADNRVAAAIAIKTDKPVIGTQMSGTAEVVTDLAVIESVMKDYILKYDSGHTFYEKAKAGDNQHHMYRLKPEAFVLFDEVHFPQEGRVEWQA
jgi:uncharacterized protein YhbP (UPF0306 family)